MSDVITYSGWLMTAVSLTVAYFQFKRTKRMAQRSKQELLGFIRQSNDVIVKIDFVKKGTKKSSDAGILLPLTSAHQAGSELYQNLVNYYLVEQDSFSYKDLRKICKSPIIISYKWQEDWWRISIGLRKENKNVDTPDERHINDSKSSRTQNKERGIEPKLVEEKPA